MDEIIKYLSFFTVYQFLSNVPRLSTKSSQSVINTNTPYLGAPPVIRINVQVVSCNDHESRGGELLLGDVYVHHSLMPQSILGYTSQEVPNNELIHSPFVTLDTEETESYYFTLSVFVSKSMCPNMHKI